VTPDVTPVTDAICDFWRTVKDTPNPTPTAHQPIPFVDLKAQYQALKPDIDAAIQAVIDESAFIRGRFVTAFETQFAQAYGVKHCISTGNGTDALYIVMKMLGIGPGDEVITTANSWIASSETVTQTGARVVFVDIEPHSFNLDPDKVEAAITPRTKAVIAVHLLGQPAQIDQIKRLCDTHGLYLIEDCAQAHFAEFGGRRVGTFGVAATFSFYPGKNLGAYGDAGAIVTSDDDLADKCRSYARHGASLKDKHDHLMEGINSRMDGLQAAVLSVKLPHVFDWNQKRAMAAAHYGELLRRVPGIIELPQARPDATHIYHVYCIRVKDREAVNARLNAAGIGTSIHYPIPLPFLKAYRYLEHEPSDFPLVWRNHTEILSLPIYPEITLEQQQRVASVLAQSG